MAQLVDFATNPEKNKDWHLYFLRELIEYVATETPSDRKYTKWLRERKVFDRRFIAFCERLLGFPRQPGQAPVLGEVGKDLWDALQRSKKKLEDDAEKARHKPAKLDLPPNGPIPQPGRRAAPQPRPVTPDDELDEDRAWGGGADRAPPAATADGFQKEVLDRFVELHGYLARFVLGEIGDGYLAVSELYRRVGTSAYVGRRPSMPQFETWVRWGEWLAAIEKIGFRHRATAAGRDLGKYLKSLPESELLVATPEDELLIEVPVATPAPAAPAGPILVPNAPTNRRSLEVRPDDEDGDGEDDDDRPSPARALAADEGLDLPPETRAPEPAERYWAERPHDDAAVARGPLPDPVVTTLTPPPPLEPSPASASLERPIASPPVERPPATVATPPVAPQLPTPLAAPLFSTTPVDPATDSILVETGEHLLPTSGRSRSVKPPTPPPPAREPASAAWARPVVPYSTDSLDPSQRPRMAAAAGHVLAWWESAGRPGERVHARDAGVDLARYAGAGRGVLVFKLLVVGALLEAPVERSAALAFARELEGRRAFDALFIEEHPLSRVLELAGLLDPARTLGPCAEKLIHALRFRAGLKRDGLVARLDAAPGGRELARLLRREVTGDSLGSGVVFAVREMARAGHWRFPGIDTLACVPWRDVREAAFRLGLLDEPRAATFEDLLAASQALSRFFREQEEAEAPLAAYARSTGWSRPRPAEVDLL